MYVAGDGPKPTEGSVVAYDAATGSQEDGIELMACSLTSGAREGLWSSGCPNTERLEQGPRGLRVAKTLPLPFPEPLTAGNLRQCQCDMSAGGGAVWILGDAADRRVWKVDAKRAQVVGEARIPFAIGRGVAAAGDSVWVAGPLDDVVARVDARTPEGHGHHRRRTRPDRAGGTCGRGVGRQLARPNAHAHRCARTGVWIEPSS